MFTGLSHARPGGMAATLAGMEMVPGRAPSEPVVAKVRCRALGGLASELTVKGHDPIRADEPVDFAAGALIGTDTGWTPVQYQLGALISCANVAIALTAQDLGVRLEALEIRAATELELGGLLDGGPERPVFRGVEIEYRVDTPEPAARIAELAAEADRRCPQLGLYHRAGVPVRQSWTRDGEELAALGPEVG